MSTVTGDIKQWCACS